MTAVLKAVDPPTHTFGPELDRHLRPAAGEETQRPVVRSLAAATPPDQMVDPSARGGAEQGGRPLSVAEIQQALRELRTRRSGAPVGDVDAPPRVWSETNRERWTETGGSSQPRHDGDADNRTAPRPDRADRGELPAEAVTVLAAHSGAGASTVALAISDAAAAADRRVHLVETAPPSRSGLVAATSAELGCGPTGSWRRGVRSSITIDRRATEIQSGCWPTLPVGDGAVITVIDLGSPAATDLARLATASKGTVVVCRATVPGVRLTEQVLGRLTAPPIGVAALGPRRWPGDVTASLGPRFRALRAADRVVPVPMDPRLAITGPTSSRLPKPVLAAGRALLALLDGDRPKTAAEPAASVTSRRGSAR